VKDITKVEFTQLYQTSTYMKGTSQYVVDILYVLILYYL